MKICTDTVYECEYCGRISKSKGGTSNHERLCRHNPINQSCCTSCKFLEKQRNIDRTGTSFDNPEVTTNFICTRYNKKMYHPRIKKLQIDTREAIIRHCDEKMPLYCSEYQKD